MCLNKGELRIEYISHETIRRILQESGIKYRRTKTWKESNDPDFELKKQNYRIVSQSAKGWQGAMPR